MTIKLEDISKLRESTGAGMMDCKKALEESKGNFDKAVECLRKKGAATSAKRADRDAKEGVIITYSHGGRIASMVEVNSETDFVARNEDFKSFAKEIAMQVAASAPLYISIEDVPKDIINKEIEIETEKLKLEKKPKEVMDKIIEGKLEKFYSEVCLLKQPYIKEQEKTIEDLLNERVASIGEKISIRRFVRYEIGGK